MKIQNAKVTIALSTTTIDLEACGTKDDTTGEIKLTTLTRKSTVGDFSNGCTWLLEYPEIKAYIIEQLEAL
jgi:hypothetical protein